MGSFARKAMRHAHGLSDRADRLHHQSCTIATKLRNTLPRRPRIEDCGGGLHGALRTRSLAKGRSAPYFSPEAMKSLPGSPFPVRLGHPLKDG
jgi:hypothetical protein